MPVLARMFALLALVPGPTVAQRPAGPVTDTLIATGPIDSVRVTIAGEGPTVVLIPGLFGSAFGYRRLLADLPAAGFRAVVIEPLGIGGSPRPANADYSLTAQADRLATAIEAVTNEPALVVAHSVGASMAFRLAYRHPELVLGIVSLNGGPAEAAATPGFGKAMKLAGLFKWLGFKPVRSRIRKGLVQASGDPSWITDEVVVGYTKTAAADLGATIRAFRAMAKATEPESLGPRLSEITVPVLLLVGTAPGSGGIPGDQIELLAGRLRNFAVDSVAGAGQYLFEEQPDRVVAAITRAATKMTVASAAVRP